MSRLSHLPLKNVVIVLILTIILSPVATAGDREMFKDMLTVFKRPSITMSYGFTENTLNGLSQSFADPRSVELRLGGVRMNEMTRNIIGYKHNSLALTSTSNRLGSGANAAAIEADIWRIGGMWEEGYGYGFGDMGPALILTHAHGMRWSKLDLKTTLVSLEDKELLSLYEGAFRFGTTTQAGAVFHIAPSLALTGGFERTVIFRRHVFWPWIGSAALEQAGHWALDGFVESIGEVSPGALPIVNFVLKNALSYGVYQLRKGKMNFPFKSEAPILQDTFKAGVMVVF